MAITNHYGYDTALRIADMYLQRFPRPQSYGVTLTSTEDDSEETFYHRMSEHEIAVLRKWELEDDNRDTMSMEEYLEGEGEHDLIDKYLSHNSPFTLNIIQKCDTQQPLSFTRFRVLQVEDDALVRPCYINVPLSDDEYKQLFVLAVLNDNHLTMNMIINDLPNIAQQISKHISGALLDFVIETKQAFIFEPIEIHDAVASVFNPKQDVLGLFQSEDNVLRNYAN